MIYASTRPLFEKPFGEPGEKADADGEGVVVEIVTRIVQEAAVLARPVAEPQHRARASIQHERKILPPIDGATSRTTWSGPQISAATAAANSVSTAWLIVGG